MHSLIGIIVYAVDKQNAIDQAQETLDSLCGEDGQPFDYGSLFTESYAVSRWGKLRPAMKAISNSGKALIERLQKSTKDSFMDNLKRLRGILTQNKNDALYERDQDTYMFRHYAGKVGQYRGGEIHLYTWEREGICTPRDLDDALTKYKCIYEDAGNPNPYTDLTVWVVPANAHY